MELKESMKIKGTLEIWDRKKGEDFKLILRKKNLVVTTGLNLIRDRLATSSSNYIQYGAAGSGTTAPTAGDTALESILGARQAFDTVNTDTDAQARFEWSYAFNEANGTHTEAGLFTALTSGIMLCRATFSGKVKDATLERLYIWIIDISGE